MPPRAANAPRAPISEACATLAEAAAAIRPRPRAARRRALRDRAIWRRRRGGASTESWESAEFSRRRPLGERPGDGSAMDNSRFVAEEEEELAIIIWSSGRRDGSQQPAAAAAARSERRARSPASSGAARGSAAGEIAARRPSAPSSRCALLLMNTDEAYAAAVQYLFSNADFSEFRATLPKPARMAAFRLLRCSSDWPARNS